HPGESARPWSVHHRGKTWASLQTSGVGSRRQNVVDDNVAGREVLRGADVDVVGSAFSIDLIRDEVRLKSGIRDRSRNRDQNTLCISGTQVCRGVDLIPGPDDVERRHIGVIQKILNTDGASKRLRLIDGTTTIQQHTHV